MNTFVHVYAKFDHFSISPQETVRGNEISRKLFLALTMCELYRPFPTVSKLTHQLKYSSLLYMDTHGHHRAQCSISPRKVLLSQ